jgi:hypothetical protein
MSQRCTKWIGVSFVTVWSVAIVEAQPDFQRTKVVDPTATDFANFNDIQAAIEDITVQSGQHWTVLICPGVYTIDGSPQHPLIHLDGADERISLVGVDRQSVIIKVTTTGSGIKITSGDETSRDCRIANLTIQTTNGHGIEIVKGGGGAQTPKNITIEGVTIEATGTDKHGIDGAAAEEVRIFNCDVHSAAGHGVVLGSSYTLDTVTVTAPASGASGIHGIDRNGIQMRNCTADAALRALFLREAEEVLIVGSTFRGQTHGAFINGLRNIELHDCLLAAEGSQGDVKTAFIGDGSHAGGEDILLKGCRMEAIRTSDGTGWAIAADIEAQQVARFLDCQFEATNTTGPAVGVFNSGGENVVIIGGSITTAAPARETRVWDLEDTTLASLKLRASGVRFSKFKGPIYSAGRPRSVVQRMLNVELADSDGIVDSADLDGETIVFDPPEELDNYRALQAGWNNPGAGTISVTVLGTNWGGDDIAEAFELSAAATTKSGFRPFKTVKKIFIPEADGTLSVGTTNKLGLYYPISATSQVMQEARLVSGGYTVQSTGTVDAVYSTVIPSTISAGDSFEWAVLASE